MLFPRFTMTQAMSLQRTALRWMVAAVGTNIVLKQITFPGCIIIVYRNNASARAEYRRADAHICSTPNFK
jgi:hypothetical protein